MVLHIWKIFLIFAKKDYMRENQLKFSKEEVLEYYQYYNAGHSIKETAEYFKVHYRDILHYFIYFGYYKPTRKQSSVHNLCINNSFFNTIDNPLKAYFLGLIMSDGYIMTTLYNKEVGLALKAEDKYILDILNSHISPEKKMERETIWKELNAVSLSSTTEMTAVSPSCIFTSPTVTVLF